MAIDRNEAAAALASMREVKSKLAKGPRWTWAHHIAFGALFGGLFAVQAAPLPWRSAGLVVFLVGVVLLKRWSRDASGRFINGYRKGRTRVVTLSLLAIFIPLYLFCAWLNFSHRMPLAPIYGGIAMFPMGVFADWLWVKAYDADMAEGK